MKTSQFTFVSVTGFEPVTPTLSRWCSKPTELNALRRAKIELNLDFLWSFASLLVNFRLIKISNGY